MKKLLAFVLALVLVLSLASVCFAEGVMKEDAGGSSGSGSSSDVNAVNGPAPAGGGAVRAIPEGTVPVDYTKILDASGLATIYPAADALEDVDAAIARIEGDKELAGLADAMKDFFEEYADNIGQGVVNVPDEILEGIPTDEFGVPVKAKDVKRGDPVTVILLFPTGDKVTLDLTAPVDEIVVLPISKEAAKNIAYVILKK